MVFTGLELAIAAVISLLAIVASYFVVKVAFNVIKALIIPALIIAGILVGGLFIVEGGNALGYWYIDTSVLDVYIPNDVVSDDIIK